MPTSGEICLVDFEVPEGHEAGFPRPALVVTANDVLAEGTPIVQVVPLTSIVRHYQAEMLIEAGAGLSVDSVAQRQHIRSIASSRLSEPVARVPPVQLRQVRETLALLLDL